MPDISAAGTYTKNTARFSGLKATPKPRVLSFNKVTNIGNPCIVQARNDENELFTIEDGLITSATDLPVMLNLDLEVDVQGSPDFNLTISELD